MSYQLGSGYSYRLSFSQFDFDRFASLSEDDNPIHVDPEFAAHTKFGKTVAHGMLLYSVICRGLSQQFPVYMLLSQRLMFPTPTYVSQELTVRHAITNKDPHSELLELNSQVLHANGEIGCDSITQLSPAPNPGNYSMYVEQPVSPDTSAVDSFKGLNLRQRATHERTFSQSDIKDYVDLSGDRNLLHDNFNFARENGFKNVVIPGPLLAGMFSYLLGTELPGRGTNWLKMTLNFLAPAYLDEQITAQVSITRFRPGKDLVNLELISTDSAGDMLCRGDALVLVKDLTPPV